MRQVLEYYIPANNYVHHISLNYGAQILGVLPSPHNSNEVILLVMDDDSVWGDYATRSFVVSMTGNFLTNKDVKYIGSVLNKYDDVYHLFEVT